jgi:hypothetical protein
VPDVLESGADVPPAQILSGRGSVPLTARDREVRAALQALKGEGPHARPSAPALTARNAIP